MADYLPAASAGGNDDTVRQANAAAFYFGLGDLFKGTDDMLTMDSSTRNNGLLGPTPTLGVDIGVGSNGDFYLRGTAQTAPATPPAGASVKPGFKMTPLGWALVIGAAVLLFRR